MTPALTTVSHVWTRLRLLPGQRRMGNHHEKKQGQRSYKKHGIKSNNKISKSIIPTHSSDIKTQTQNEEKHTQMMTQRSLSVQFESNQARKSKLSRKINVYTMRTFPTASKSPGRRIRRVPVT